MLVSTCTVTLDTWGKDPNKIESNFKKLNKNITFLVKGQFIMERQNWYMEKKWTLSYIQGNLLNVKKENSIYHQTKIL